MLDNEHPYTFFQSFVLTFVPPLSTWTMPWITSHDLILIFSLRGIIPLCMAVLDSAQFCWFITW